jgi:hypothetical protein
VESLGKELDIVGEAEMICSGPEIVLAWRV